MRQILLALLAVFWITPALAGGLTDMTPDERTSFRAEVRAYLLDNPEVLMEAIAVLDQRQQQAQQQGDQALIGAWSNDIYNDGYSYVGGNLDGDITLVEFMDYRCGYCRKAHDEVAELIKSDGNIRFIVKEFPILGEQSTISSQLAIATLHKAGPEPYARLYDILIKFNGNLNDANMTVMLKKVGADPAPILAYMNDRAVKGQIGRVHALASKLKVSGTPTFVLGKDVIRGYVPLANMRELVKVARAAKN